MSSPHAVCGETFLRFAVSKLRQQEQRIHEAAALLSDDVFRTPPNQATNSVAQLCLHLAGNLRQWVLHGIAGHSDVRDRDAEFDASDDGAQSREQVLGLLAQTVAETTNFLESLDPTRLPERIRPQGYDVSVLEAIFHVTEHFSYHAGQIFLLVKIHSSKDLAFYSHLAKSNKTHNERLP